MAIVVFESHLDVIKDALPKVKRRALENIGGMAETYAKELCPVDTGTLRNSISHASTDSEMAVGSAVEYAPYVELGTIKMAARPYLRPAVENHLREYQDILENELKKADLSSNGRETSCNVPRGVFVYSLLRAMHRPKEKKKQPWH